MIRLSMPSRPTPTFTRPAHTWRRALAGIGAGVVLAALAPALVAAPANAAVVQPSADNTGVPSGTSLKAVYGTMKITTSGTYSNLDVHGFIWVQANNVVIQNSIVRGGSASKNSGLINSLWGNTGLVVRYVDLVPEHPSVYLDGIVGANYTLDHVDVRGTVDGAKALGPNVKIKYSYIHDLKSYSSDPNQGGGPTHNDGVQVLGGKYTAITYNTIRAATTQNSALQVTQSQGSASNLSFSNNWAGGGACTVNISAKPLGGMSGVVLSYNHFYNDSRYNCAMIVDKVVSYSATGNTLIGSAGAPKTLGR
jgi:hypothetical protein